VARAVSPEPEPAIAGTRRGGMGLRGRLLTAFLLVSVPPLLLLAVSVTTLFGRRYERRSEEQLHQVATALRDEIPRLRAMAEERVSTILREQLVSFEEALTLEETLRTWPAEELARRHGLAVLELVDASGRLLASSHWPAGFGLPDEDGLFPGEASLRLETVASGYGAARRLAVTAERVAEWRGARVTVRGGYLLDSDYLARLSTLLGVAVGLYDEVRGLWIAPSESVLSGLAFRGDASTSGVATLKGASYQWAAEALRPSLWLVVAGPRAELLSVVSQVHSVTFLIGAFALLICVAAGVVLSGRIARPVRALADGARRVAAGDLNAGVEVLSTDEVGELARAFNSMTAELVASRDRLLQAERVAAWREMARRLAHELKNPLFPIQLSIETLQRAFVQEGGRDFQSLFPESTRTVLQEIGALRKTIDEFSEFARMPRPRPRPASINETVERVLALYRAQAGDVRVEAELAQGLPAVSFDPDLLGRAIGNLIKNALEAMPGGGTLRVSTGRGADLGSVQVAVEDDGPGLTPEQQSRLFTPYYTTKKAGTGLGLAIVQGIVSDHGGRIRVESAPEQGTRFTIVLPSRPPLVRS
jgi:two-component system, NtrC family, nitrogen regulation sensor histidine kinase NtrY